MNFAHWLCLSAMAWLLLHIIYNLIFWRIYDENWAWIHQRHRVTGAVRHIQKVRGVPMAPPPPHPDAPPPPIKIC